MTMSTTLDEAGDASVVRDVYRAGAGLVPWSRPLGEIGDRLGLWVVTFFAIDRRTGRLLFCHEGTRRAPEISRAWAEEYGRIDPRAALVAASPVGRWVACDEHFDERFVEHDPFYQRFLLPHGGRYVYGSKVAEDETSWVGMAFSRGLGSAQLDRVERAVARRLSNHVLGAWRMQGEMAAARRNPAAIRQRFGLTATEARVASQLADGHAPAEIARRLEIKTSTVRSHLKSLLHKTGTHRQSELVSLLLRAGSC